MHGTWSRLVINTLHICENWCSHNGILMCCLTTFLSATIIRRRCWMSEWVSEPGVAVEYRNNGCSLKNSYLPAYIHTYIGGTYIYTHRHAYTQLLVALRPNAGHGLLILQVSRSHTTTEHSRYESLDEWIARRDLYLTTHKHPQQISMPPAGFELNLRRPDAAYLRLRRRGHRNRHIRAYIHKYVPTYIQTLQTYVLTYIIQILHAYMYTYRIFSRNLRTFLPVLAAEKSGCINP